MVKLLLPVFIRVAVLLIAARRIDWINAWVYAGLDSFYQLLVLGVSLGVMIKMGMDLRLLNEHEIRIRKNIKSFDKVSFSLAFVLLYFALLILAGFDATRYEWSNMFSGGIILGVFSYTLAYILEFWGIATIIWVHAQENKNRRFYTSGPFKIIRFPMHVGMILMVLGIPLILGSWWSLIPAGAINVLIVIHTALKDRKLQSELPNYKEYSTMTRYRLLPLVW